MSLGAEDRELCPLEPMTESPASLSQGLKDVPLGVKD